MPIADRCWCDVRYYNFFNPFNVTRWELSSIDAMADDLVKRHQTLGSGLSGDGDAKEMKKSSSLAALSELWRRASGQQAKEEELEDMIVEAVTDSEGSLESPPDAYDSWFRREYDLRPLGFDIIVEFGLSEKT
jgi:hypothetical protein